jgi:hypothetical protein
LLKRASHETLSPSGSFDSHSSFSSNKSSTNNRTNSAATAAAAKNTGTTKAAALSFRKPSTAAAAAAAVPSGAAVRVREAGGSGGVGENAVAAKIYYDTSSEVAEMAARVLRRHNAAAS